MQYWSIAYVTISRLLIRGFAIQTRKKAENSRQALITKLQFASTTDLNELNKRFKRKDQETIHATFKSLDHQSKASPWVLQD